MQSGFYHFYDNSQVTTRMQHVVMQYLRMGFTSTKEMYDNHKLAFFRKEINISLKIVWFVAAGKPGGV